MVVCGVLLKMKKLNSNNKNLCLPNSNNNNRKCSKNNKNSSSNNNINRICMVLVSDITNNK